MHHGVRTLCPGTIFLLNFTNNKFGSRMFMKILKRHPQGRKEFVVLEITHPPLGAETLFRIVCKECVDQGLRSFGKPLGVTLDFKGNEAFCCLALIFNPERRATSEHLVYNAAECPPVDGLGDFKDIVSITGHGSVSTTEQLGSKVGKGALEGHASLCNLFNRTSGTKVPQLHVAISMNEHILRFKITKNKTCFVDGIKCSGDLTSNKACSIFVQGTNSCQCCM
mmetsp:Transcript_16029/g.30998  ORF Transcript_16029/g.30998 Transcript_16029/m.30998 type:complete len:224 (-) Transcript_16029:1643-2314(-)